MARRQSRALRGWWRGGRGGKRERRPAGPVQQPWEVNEHFSAGSFIIGSEGWKCQKSIVPVEKEEKEATLVCPPSFFVCFCFNILACTTKCNSDRLSKLLCIKKAKQNPFLSVILTFRKALQIFFFYSKFKIYFKSFFSCSINWGISYRIKAFLRRSFASN